jgi:hypothetical protein
MIVERHFVREIRRHLIAMGVYCRRLPHAQIHAKAGRGGDRQTNHDAHCAHASLPANFHAAI